MVSKKDWAPGEMDEIHRIIAVLRRRNELSFEDAVREYRQIEAEFVERAGDDTARVVETERRVTNHLLIHAESTEQPHEVCREIWEELLQRGFWDITMRHTMSSTYVRCCQENGEFNAGIAVLEPRIAELKQLLDDPTLTPDDRALCELFISMHETTRDELKAGIRESLMPHSGPWEPEEIALTQRVNAVAIRERKHGLSFNEAIREYRQVEAEFVQRAGDDASRVVETQRRITEAILRLASDTEQPHDVCRTTWEELVLRGFSNLERRHYMSDTYVECCLFNGEFAAGLVVLEPLIVELEQCVEDTTTTTEMRHFCETWLNSHRSLRDKLKAGMG